MQQIEAVTTRLDAPKSGWQFGAPSKVAAAAEAAAWRILEKGSRSVKKEDRTEETMTKAMQDSVQVWHA